MFAVFSLSLPVAAPSVKTVPTSEILVFQVHIQALDQFLTQSTSAHLVNIALLYRKFKNMIMLIKIRRTF